MNPLSMLLLTLFLGAFAAYLVGRVVDKIRDDQAGGTAAGLAAVAVLVLAGRHLLSLGGLVAGGRIVLVNAGVLGSTLAVMLRADGLSVFMTGITLALGLLAAVYSLSYLKHDTGVDKFFPVLLLMLGAMAGLAFADDLFNLFIFYEMMSVASFILVSYRKESWEPIEAGFKYIVLSSVGSFFLLLGIVLVFMYTGELNLSRVAAALTAVPPQPKLLMISLFIAGFGVKAALVPLHTWLPDAHSAAPSSVSALLSAVVIQTGLLAMLRVLLEGFAGSHQTVGLVFVTFGALTMTVGNLTALQQTDLKRMLAYSSIAQMGFILLGLGLGLKYGVPLGLDGGTFHIMTHAFAKGLAFLAAGALIEAAGTREIARMRGLGRQVPLAGAAFAVAALGLAGVPPFAGFMSKLLIYEAGFKVGSASGILLACLAIANSVISLGYYLPAMSTLFARTEGKPGRLTLRPLPMALPMLILVAVTLVLGVWPELGLRAVYPAVKIIASLKGVN